MKKTTIQIFGEGIEFSEVTTESCSEGVLDDIWYFNDHQQFDQYINNILSGAIDNVQFYIDDKTIPYSINCFNDLKTITYCFDRQSLIQEKSISNYWKEYEIKYSEPFNPKNITFSSATIKGKRFIVNVFYFDTDQGSMNSNDDKKIAYTQTFFEAHKLKETEASKAHEMTYTSSQISWAIDLDKE